MSQLKHHKFLSAFLLLSICIGCFLHVSNLGRKIFWGDETYTALRVSGFAQRDIDALYDGKVHTVRQIQTLQTVNPQHGLAATISSLAHDDPQHAPLFYVAERLWAGAFGDSPAQLRLVSALIGLLALPAMYFLCLELFSDRLSALIGTALIAVSPFHEIYAHEAREYSLWTLAILVSSLLLLRAIRTNTNWAWGGYACGVAFALYSYLLSVYVLAAHALWVAIYFRRDLGVLKRFAIACIGGCILFAPWIVEFWQNRQSLGGDLSWGLYHYPLSAMVQKWAFNAASTLFDVEYANLHLVVIALLAAILLFVGVGVTARTAPRRTAVFLLCLGAVITVIMVGEDFKNATYYSTIARYLTPLWISLELALTWCFAVWLKRPQRVVQAIAGVVLVAVLVLGTASSIVGGRAQSWWNNHLNADAAQLADRVNAQDRPLIISAYRPYALLVLSHYLKPETSMLLLGYSHFRELPPGFRSFDVLSPTNDELTEISTRSHLQVIGSDYFEDKQSPIERFHSQVRAAQASKHERVRDSSQEFLIFIGSKAALNR